MYFVKNKKEYKKVSPDVHESLLCAKFDRNRPLFFAKRMRRNNNSIKHFQVTSLFRSREREKNVPRRETCTRQDSDLQRALVSNRKKNTANQSIDFNLRVGWNKSGSVCFCGSPETHAMSRRPASRYTTRFSPTSSTTISALKYHFFLFLVFLGFFLV